MKKLMILLLFTLPVTSFSKEGTTLLFLGDSLTEGYGNEKNEAYPSLIEKKLKEKGLTNIKILNGGVSGSTTASGLSRMKWFIKAKPDILILALGANDGLRGLKVSESKKNLKDIIEFAFQNKMKVLLCGMKVPPNYGKSYALEFSKMFVDLSKELKTYFIPFLLEGVAGNKKLNIEDGVHPNAKGHEVISEHVLKKLEKLI